MSIGEAWTMPTRRTPATGLGSVRLPGRPGPAGGRARRDVGHPATRPRPPAIIGGVTLPHLFGYIALFLAITLILRVALEIISPRRRR